MDATSFEWGAIMRLTIRAALMAALLSVAVTACGGSSTKGDVGAAAPPTTDATQATAEATTPSGDATTSSAPTDSSTTDSGIPVLKGDLNLVECNNDGPAATLTKPQIQKAIGLPIKDILWDANNGGYDGKGTYEGCSYDFAEASFDFGLYKGSDAATAYSHELRFKGSMTEAAADQIKNPTNLPGIGDKAFQDAGRHIMGVLKGDVFFEIANYGSLETSQIMSFAKAVAAVA